MPAGARSGKIDEHHCTPSRSRPRPLRGDVAEAVEAHRHVGRAVAEGDDGDAVVGDAADLRRPARGRGRRGGPPAGRPGRPAPRRRPPSGPALRRARSSPAGRPRRRSIAADGDAQHGGRRQAVAERFDQQAQPLAEATTSCRGRWYGSPRACASRAALAGGRGQPLHDAAVLLLQGRPGAGRRRATLSSAGSPAWMPVTRASAKTSATSRPARRRAKASIDSSPAPRRPGGGSARPEAPACRARLSRSAVQEGRRGRRAAAAAGRRGTGSGSGGGLAGGNSRSPRPRSRQRARVVGLVSRKPLGPISTWKPSRRSVQTVPPGRGRSRTVTSARGPAAAGRRRRPRCRADDDDVAWTPAVMPNLSPRGELLRRGEGQAACFASRQPDDRADVTVSQPSRFA